MNTEVKKLTPGQVDDATVQLEHVFVDILLNEAGLPEREATRQAVVLVKGLRKEYGGLRLGTRGLYIPAPDKTERDAAIRREFNGTNGPELRRKYGLGRTRFYEIIGKPRNAVRIGVPSAKSPAPPMPNSPLSSRENGQKSE